MNYEEFRSVTSDSGPWTYDGWRCVYCGEIVDSLVLLNRERSKTLMQDESEPVEITEGRRIVHRMAKHS